MTKKRNFKKNGLSKVSLFMSMALGGPVFATSSLDPMVVMKNNEAIDLLSQEQSFESYKELLSALEREPLNPILHLNLGLIFLANKEEEKAIKEFHLAEQLSQKMPEIKFTALFNQGILLGKMKKKAEAFEKFQEALDLKPDSLDTRKAIELLWMQSGGEGEGEGEGDQEKEGEGEDKEGQGKGPKDQGPEPKQEKKKKPQPFESKDLSKEQVRKILEELKAQEQAIRAGEYKKGVKDAPRDKDW